MGVYVPGEPWLIKQSWAEAAYYLLFIIYNSHEYVSMQVHIAYGIESIVVHAHNMWRKAQHNQSRGWMYD